MEQACKAAGAKLESGCDVLAAVAAALVVLENAPLTNAGNGSNLNRCGAVECDASVMSGDGTFGAIGAAPGISNPASAAFRLALDSREPLPHGLVRPLVLAGDAARAWALERGLTAAATAAAAAEMHVTAKAQERHANYMYILEGNDGGAKKNGSSSKKRRRQSSAALDEERSSGGADCQRLNDTVGCVVVDAKGQVAAGVSSGGLALKLPGRVGEAAVFGAGCWAENQGASGVATSVTGVGERIIKGLVARESAKEVLRRGTHTSVAAACSQVLENTVAAGPPPRECGVLAIAANVEPSGGGVFVELAAVHWDSKSMAVGWLAQNHDGRRQSKAGIMRRGEEHQGTVQVLTTGVHWAAGS